MLVWPKSDGSNVGLFFSLHQQGQHVQLLLAAAILGNAGGGKFARPLPLQSFRDWPLALQHKPSPELSRAARASPRERRGLP